eukprot:Platyproteum_vivax@DN7326_c0_g1_i2.p1
MKRSCPSFTSIVKNYYTILGISHKSSDVEIKQAFYKLAKEHHPDTNPSGSGDKFKLLNEAYQALSRNRTDHDSKLRNAGMWPAEKPQSQQAAPRRSPGARKSNAWWNDNEGVYDFEEFFEGVRQQYEARHGFTQRGGGGSSRFYKHAKPPRDDYPEWEYAEFTDGRRRDEKKYDRKSNRHDKRDREKYDEKKHADGMHEREERTQEGGQEGRHQYDAEDADERSRRMAEKEAKRAEEKLRRKEARKAYQEKDADRKRHEWEKMQRHRKKRSEFDGSDSDNMDDNHRDEFGERFEKDGYHSSERHKYEAKDKPDSGGKEKKGGGRGGVFTEECDWFWDGKSGTNKQGGEVWTLVSRSKTDGSYTLPPRLDPKFTLYGNRIEPALFLSSNVIAKWLTQNADRGRLYGVFRNGKFQYSMVYKHVTQRWGTATYPNQQRSSNQENVNHFKRSSKSSQKRGGYGKFVNQMPL